MRILKVTVLAVLVAFGSTSASKAANDGPWCYAPSAVCNTPTARITRECLMAAGVLGGVCERNHRPAPEEARKGKRKPPKQARVPQT